MNDLKMSSALRQQYEERLAEKREKRKKERKERRHAKTFKKLTSPNSVPETSNEQDKSPVTSTGKKRGADTKSESGNPPRKRMIGQPRPPTASLSIYNTEHYQIYDKEVAQEVEPVIGAFVSFNRYNHYKLYINPFLKTIDDIPEIGVRLDDLTISRVLGSLGRALHRAWPADFDQQGMIRATRIPLGLAAKIWVKAGAVDVDGELIPKDGYYYSWWRGLHCLMGKEGYDAGHYLIRPSYESFKCRGFGIKVGYRAVMQTAESESGKLVVGEDVRPQAAMQGGDLP